MSFWIHAYCNDTAASIGTQELRQGIADRLALITYLFCPDEEEDPADVLNRLVIDCDAPPWRECLLHYGTQPSGFIPMVRHDRGAVVERIEELHDIVPREPRLKPILEQLANVKEDVSFSLKTLDVRGMGFPLAIAAAAYLIDRVGGIILSGTYSWMIPSGREVDIILEFAA